jgi:hypothetical protein
MYPQTPGSKGGGASKDAAKRMSGRVAMLRDNVTNLMLKGYWLTADEIATLLRENVLAIRPRVSELVKANVLVKTADRRRNMSGMSAHVLRHRLAVTPVELPKVEPVTKRKATAVHHDQNALFSGVSQ